MKSCIRMKCHRDSKVTKRMMMYSCIAECWRVCFSPSSKHPFSSQKMHVVIFSPPVFLNVILVSYKSEIDFQPLAPVVFLFKISLPFFFPFSFQSTLRCSSFTELKTYSSISWWKICSVLGGEICFCIKSGRCWLLLNSTELNRPHNQKSSGKGQVDFAELKLKRSFPLRVSFWNFWRNTILVVWLCIILDSDWWE